MFRDESESPQRSDRGGEPAPLAALLASVRARRGWDRRLRGARVFEHWPAIAGEELARHVEPVRLAGGVLVLRAESSAWATQVRYLSAELVRRANDVLGDGAVTKVTLSTGRLRG
ncbi:MAG: DUF721 domain-containing protein [Egibacteraceae bacterium]